MRTAISILENIFAYKHEEVAARCAQKPLNLVRQEAQSAPVALDFIAALRRQPAPALIAEIKRASPSRGLLVADFDPLRLASQYVSNGARAISILTDERFFQGSLDYLVQVRRQFPHLPLLRKDFLYDPYQLYEARAAGADAVLLIAAGLASEQLCELHALAVELGMAALVEVHNLEELEQVLPMQPQLVGVNNRDLHTFQVDLETTLSLRPYIPPDVTLVAESGIHSAADVARLAGAGVNAILVGEALVTAADTAAKVRELSSL
jgi:indole-3-glycerol phosphate synthase